MSNEPIAYINIEERRLQWAGPVKWDTPIITKMDKIPLYTHPINPKYDPETGEPLIDGYPLFSGLPHPVKDKPHPKCDEACMYLCQMRELTDEEIIAVGNAVVNHIDSNEGWIEFARAILRKAQEK